ncbi:MAG: efflux RND transporter permease subunit [Planctomycetota bacterium]
MTWFTRNSVAANLVMLALLIGGGLAAFNIRQEVFPTFQLDFVDVQMSYPGASPAQVEDGIILPIEEQVRALEVAERVVSTATEGGANIEIELTEGVDPNRAVQDVANAIDRINFFPEDAEQPTIGLRQERDQVMWLVAYGPLTEREILQLAERIRRDLLALPELSQVDVGLARRPEITIEVPQETLRALGMTTGQVADIIGESARDLPGGGVRTPGGDVLLRTAERRDFASAYSDIPLVSTPEGTKIRVGDVASVNDGFEDRRFENYYNGGRGVFIFVYRTGDEKPLEIAAAVNSYLEQLRAELPAGVDVDVLRDRGEQYRSRLSLLVNNGVIGFALVLGVLGLFLQPRLAIWVAIGVPTTLVGALVLLPALGASINMISLFAFIVTLGIVVDDAVIVGENVFHKIQLGMGRMQAAIEGSREMIVPVLFAVATNIVAFLPLLFVPGETGRFFAPLPAVVMAVFVISIVEALFVLPAHLGHGGSRQGLVSKALAPINRLQQRFSDGFERATDRFFTPLLRASLRWRYVTLAVIMAASGLVLAYYQSGRVNYNFTPVIPGLRVDAEVQTASGAPFADTVRVAKLVEAAGVRAANRLGGIDEVVQGRMNVIGRLGENWSDINFILMPAEQRGFTQAEFAAVWREEIGEVSGLDSLFFEWEEGPGSGAGLTIELSHPDRRMLESAATRLASALSEYEAVTDVKDGFAAGKPQLDVELTPTGRSLGMTSEDVARQVRDAFFGAEALRFQRGRHELWVMVRLPESERQSLAAVENLIIQPPGGGEVTLSQVAELVPNRAFTQIDRVDGRRILNVSSNIDPEIANINDVRAAIERDVFPSLRADHAGLEIGFSGRQREEARAMAELRVGLIVAGAVIFALLAGLFRSYLQAVAVMGIIPVAAAAAIVGHVVLGRDLSIVSLFGIIALCGLAVNGGLVLTQEMNRRHREEREPVFDAALGAARRRFRPILLTSLTTFAGLAPMIFETDPQALFLVPMAIALGFGTLVSGVLVLFGVPAALLAVKDGERLFLGPTHSAIGEGGNPASSRRGVAASQA